MKAFFRGVALSLCTLSILHANTTRQTISNFRYTRAISKTDFTSAGATTLMETFTINNPGTYTLVQDIGYQAHNNSATAGESCAIYINSSNVVLDLGSFTLYNNSNADANSVTKAIDINTEKDNIVIKNGNINGFSETGINIRSGTRNIRLQDLTINGCGLYGISCVGTAGISNINADLLVQNCHISDTTRANNRGMRITFTENILMQDVVIGFSNNTTASNESMGILFSTCTNIRCNQVNSSGHLGDGAYGFSLTAINSALFENCQSLGNYAIDSTATQTCVGFFVETSTAVTFNNCVSSGHAAGREAQGFLYSNVTGCITENCVANGMRNNATVPNSTETLFAGFFSVNGVGNMWKNCIAENNFAGTGAAQDGEGAVGFYLSSELQSALIGCKARGHGSLYAHTTNAIGIYLDNRRSRTGMKKEDCQYCQIRACEASSNCTSATAGTTAYGIRDISTSTKNLITECFAFGNSDSASTRVITNYYMNLAVGQTTPANWPRLETNMDSLIDLANTPDFYNVSITS